jgi:hypothetical protein
MVAIFRRAVGMLLAVWNELRLRRMVMLNDWTRLERPGSPGGRLARRFSTPDPRAIIKNKANYLFKDFLGGFFVFLSYYIQRCFICRLSDSTFPTDAGIEHRTVATDTLAVRSSNN